MATTAIKPKNSFAKNIKSQTKRLIQQKHLKQPSSMLHRKMRQASFHALPSGSRCDHQDNSVAANPTSAAPTTPFLPRLCEEKDDDEELYARHRWRSPIGTIADHRMTNNNRIHNQWHIFAVICFSLLLGMVQVTVVNGHPDPVPTPIRVSHSYTKTVSNTIPTSTTSRSTTQITSFLPSDAISSFSSAVINYKNYNAFPSSRSNSSGSSSNLNSNMYSFKPSNASSDYNSNNFNNNHNDYNANIQPSSRRLASAKHTDRKDFSYSPVTSIDRPFYTKLTSSDAVSTPSYYKRNKAASKKPKKSKNSSSKASSSPYSKYSKGKGSKEQDSGSSMSMEDVDLDNEYSFMPHTTEKSYHPPKLSLEPFFNFLTSLATASREVIMSKEQQHTGNQHHTEQSFTTGATGSGGKYSPSYETVNQSIREGAKKSKKSKKGGSTKGKKKSKGHGKGSKKGGKGGGGKHRHHRTKSAESLEEEEEEYDIERTSNGPIPIPLPDPIIESAEDAKETGSSSDDAENSGGLHILDVLRTPMIPDYESPPPPPPPPPHPAVRAEPLVGLEFHESSSNGNSGGSSYSNDGTNAHKNAPSNTSSSSFSPSNPPSGRANMNKGQGYLAFDNYDEGSMATNVSGSMMLKPQREKQRMERDPMDSFHDQHAGVDLHAQESISHAHVLPSPFGMKNNNAGGGLAPSQYHHHHHQQQQHPKVNNEHSALQQVPPPQTNTPEIVPSGTSEQSHPTGKNDFVSKYPTTFVYQPGASSGPQPPPGPNSYVKPSPPGYLQNNAVIYGSPPLPPSSRPPFRMNKLRPNLHSYYDSSYHNYAGMGESVAASEMIGVRQPFGPPHFKPPPHGMHSPFPLPQPPRFANGYGNRPGFMMMPHRGTHYVGNTFNAPPSHKEPNVNPYENTNTDYQQDVTGNDNGSNNNNHEDSSVGNQDITGPDAAGSGADNIDQYTVSEVDDNSITAAENSETKKVGIMESFDVFYKEYKILTWVAVFFVTSMAFLCLLVYLYINNPPTEVVQARQLFPWNELLKNPQITKFLSSLTGGSGTGKRKRKKDDPGADDDGYLKPYGFGFGGKSGKQKRKQTRFQQDKDKFIERANKVKRINASGSNSSNGVSTGSVPVSLGSSSSSSSSSTSKQ